MEEALPRGSPGRKKGLSESDLLLEGKDRHRARGVTLKAGSSKRSSVEKRRREKGGQDNFGGKSCPEHYSQIN